MSIHGRLFCTALAIATISLAACGDDDDTVVDSGTDSGPHDGGGDEDDTGVDPDAATCASYCASVAANCTGADAQYADVGSCTAYCTGIAWPQGAVGAETGNSLECRAFHAARAATTSDDDCPRAGTTGGGVCGAPIDFRTDAATAYTRVDRMGMPAVSTALISSGMKNAYNDATPALDAAGTFVPDLAATLTGIHTALDDDLDGLDLEPCSMTVLVGTLPECFGQEVATDVSVADLVVPDTLQINPAAASGFPNGRALPDRVIDVTLAVILLDLGGTCGTGTCSPSTLATIPLNPGSNDATFGTTFPYLAPAWPAP